MIPQIMQSNSLCIKLMLVTEYSQFKYQKKERLNVMFVSCEARFSEVNEKSRQLKTLHTYSKHSHTTDCFGSLVVNYYSYCNQ